MRRGRLWIALGVAVVAVVVAGSLWFEPWRLFTSSYADEALPDTVAAEVLDTTTSAPTTASSPVTDSPTTGVVTTPPPEDVLISRTAFVSGEHETTGDVLLIRLASGEHLVRLMGFSTSDGPDLQVVLGSSTPGDLDVGRYLELGPLRATDGNLNYAVPTGTDVASFTTVAIWCKRFDAVFGSAPIT
ncbi:DM13 domain-containing protein [Jatrophihabitans sp. YIM 134969]